MEKASKIFVAGHRGLVGSAIVRNLRSKGFDNLILRDKSELDLCQQQAVQSFFATEGIEYVFLAAAKVGGILFNKNYQADFLYENLMIASNVIDAAAKNGVEKLLFLGSSCIYPKLAPQPISEDALLTGPLEPSNEGYAIAKIAGLKLCEKYAEQYGKGFISAMPTNLYGPNDNFHPDHSHVIPGLLRRFHEAKKKNLPAVCIWGSGTPKREFLHVDDCAEALFILMKTYDSPTTINVGTGEDLTIADLAAKIAQTVGYTGEIQLDTSKPDGTPRKVLNVSRLKELGWQAHYQLDEGLAHAYQWALDNHAFD